MIDTSQGKVLTDVSETALITLRSREIESKKQKPVIVDPVGSELFRGLLDTLSPEVKQRIINRRLSPVLTKYIAHRARKYDNLCREFVASNPDGMVLNLGCGFDTRFWRLGIPEQHYMELDLPEVMQLKKKILGERLTYHVIERSVLDREWISMVEARGAERIIVLAEGLFMYLPEAESRSILQQMADTFSNSRLVMEVVSAKYTRGLWKKMVQMKMRRGAGSQAGDFYQFGISRSSELQEIHRGIQIRGEWSYFDDEDLKPSILRLFRSFRTFARNQYTVIADIG